MVHDFPAATLAPQVLVSENSSVSAPVIAILAMLNAELVVKVVDRVWAAPTLWPPKFRLFGLSCTPTVPVPLRLTVCGLPGALSLTDNVPVRLPCCLGANVTAIVQLARMAKLEPQVLVCPKSPVVAMLAIASIAVPLLVNVTDCAGLVVFTSCVPNAMLAGERVAFGPDITPMPLNAICCGLAAALSVMVTEADRGPT